MSAVASIPVVAPAAADAVGSVIALDRLCVGYGRRRVLHDLTVSLSGRVIGLLGPNGAGKSTLIATLLGFLKPQAGSVRVLGRPMPAAAGEVRALTGYMPENDAFIANLTAVATVRIMAELAGLPAEAALERAHEALFYVGLGEARYRKLGGYSLGMKQMAKLAQAIAHGPRLLILDEPTNSLDPPARTRMLQLIREIRDTGECQIILCSHLLRDVEETCDEVVILKNGRIAHHADLAAERREHTRRLELELTADNPAFLAALVAAGCQLSPAAAGRQLLTLPDGLAVGDLYRLADQHQAALRRLNFRRDSLEDIFLRAMEATA